MFRVWRTHSVLLTGAHGAVAAAETVSPRVVHARDEGARPEGRWIKSGRTGLRAGRVRGATLSRVLERKREEKKKEEP